LYTSDENYGRFCKGALKYLGFTVFSAVFGAIYEVFSHEVYSYFMIYAFAAPLLLGVLPALIIAVGKMRVPSQLTLKAWNSGVAALTMGLLFKGVLDIYGSTNRLLIVYFIVAGILLLAGVITHIAKIGSKNKQELLT